MNQRTPEYGEVRNSSRVTPAPVPTQLDSRHRPQRCAGLFRLWPLTNSIPWNSLSSFFAPGRLLPPFCILPWSLALLHPTSFRPHSFTSHTADFWYSALCTQVHPTPPVGFTPAVAVVLVRLTLSFSRPRISSTPSPVVIYCVGSDFGSCSPQSSACQLSIISH